MSQCKYIKPDGTQCSREGKDNGYCTQHYKILVKKQTDLREGSFDTTQFPMAIPDVSPPKLPDSTDDFFQNYSITKILSSDEKQSASMTIILFAIHKKSKLLVAVKLFWDYTPEDWEYNGTIYTGDRSENYERFMYEACVYRNIKNYPMTNIVRWISTQTYPFAEFTRYVSPELVAAVLALNPSFGTPSTITLIINERRPEAKIFNSPSLTLSVADRKNLLFQIIFALAQMEANGYQHNDLRLGNILVDTLPDEKEIIYNGRILKIQKKALLFDWDLAHSEDCGQNPALDDFFCPEIGMCNAINPRFDIYTMLREYTIPGDVAFQTFKRDAGVTHRVKNIQSLTKKDWKKNLVPLDEIAEAHENRMCNMNENYGTPGIENKCKPFPHDKPSFVLPPSALLMHPYFNDLFDY
jgi:serine/threonine protein kinase